MIFFRFFGICFAARFGRVDEKVDGVSRQIAKIYEPDQKRRLMLFKTRMRHSSVNFARLILMRCLLVRAAFFAFSPACFYFPFLLPGIPDSSGRELFCGMPVESVKDKEKVSFLIRKRVWARGGRKDWGSKLSFIFLFLNFFLFFFIFGFIFFFLCIQHVNGGLSKRYGERSHAVIFQTSRAKHGILFAAVLSRCME
jgi:hypothetical protein